MEKKQIFILSLSIFIITILILITPLMIPVLGVSGNTTYFNVSLTVNGGTPIITNVQTISDSPNEGGAKTVHFYFNATHPNGVAYIPATGASVKINQSSTTLSSTGCIVSSTDGVTTNKYDCNITINYYNLPGIWSINATITDTLAAAASNTTEKYTNGNTYGIALKTNLVQFSGTPGNAVGASTNPQYINNTGNMNFTQVNLTAIELRSGSNVIGAGNFTANTTNDALGQMLINNSAVTLLNSNISINASRNLYLYANIPVGVSNGTYNSTSAWIVTVS